MASPVKDNLLAQIAARQQKLYPNGVPEGYVSFESPASQNTTAAGAAELHRRVAKQKERAEFEKMKLAFQQNQENTPEARISKAMIFKDPSQLSFAVPDQDRGQLPIGAFGDASFFTVDPKLGEPYAVDLTKLAPEDRAALRLKMKNPERWPSGY